MICDTIEQFYNAYPYPAHGQYMSALKKGNMLMSMDGSYFGASNILCVGCGTIEPVIIGKHSPQSRVVGIDISDTSLKLCQSNIDELSLDNVRVYKHDITNPLSDANYDYVLATGVLHHIEDVELALHNIKDAMATGGYFSGMVYNETGRARIPNLVIEARKTGTIRNARAFLNSYDFSKKWIESYDCSDIEFADTWLNPYFKQYTTNSLRILLEKFFGYVIISELSETKLQFKCLR